MRLIQRHRAIRGIPLFLSIAGLFMTLGVSGCGQGISPAQGVSPAQCVSPAMDLPHAVAAAVRTGDGSVLVPYLASREDYVIFTPGMFVDDPDSAASVLEIVSAEQAMTLMERCRDLGRKCGMVVEDITMNRTLVRWGPGLMAPYDERLPTGERLNLFGGRVSQGDETADTEPSRYPRGIPADVIVDIELESHGKLMSIVLNIRRTPTGPKVMEFQGCAALTIPQLRSVMGWHPLLDPKWDAERVTLITRGMVSEEFQWLGGREVYSAPRTWVLLPARCDPKDKDRLHIWFDGPDLSLLGLPECPVETEDSLIETAADSCTFVPDTPLGTTKLVMTPRVASAVMPGGTSIPEITVNGIQRHFRIAGMGGRVLVAPRETVKELLPPKEGRGGCYLRYEDGLAAEIIWGTPDAGHAPTSSSKAAVEEMK